MEFRYTNRTSAGRGLLALFVAAVTASATLVAGCGTAEPPAPHDQTLGAAEVFDIEDRPLADFLQWVAERTGCELRFSSPGARTTAGQIILHGSVDGLPPEVALPAVMATTNLTLETGPGLILIGTAAESQRSGD